MARKKIVLCDANILIELSKNNSVVIKELKTIGPTYIAVSAISAGEFIYGALNKAELARIIKALNAIQIIQINDVISERSLELLESYALSHNLKVPDSLIAVTAIVYNLEFYTLNLKDFRFIANLNLHKKK